jgi:hypothetical protein
MFIFIAHFNEILSYSNLKVLRARQRWEKEAAQMLNQYKGFRPPHAG